MFPLNVSISDISEISTNSSFGRNLEPNSGNITDNSTFSTMFSRESHHVFNNSQVLSPGKVSTLTEIVINSRGYIDVGDEFGQWTTEMRRQHWFTQTWPIFKNRIESELWKASNFTCSIMIPDSEGRMKINCSCLQSRIGDFAESSQESGQCLKTSFGPYFCSTDS